jgi:hypothetical protein
VWGYLGVRVKDRDNAYRLRVELTQAGEAKCLMQEEATDTNGDGTVDDPNGITSTLPAGGATKTLSGLDYTGASDEVSIKMEADAANDTVKGKCWSSASESPAAGAWDWTASSETTLEGSSFDRIQIRTTTADAITNDSRIRFDDLNAHSIGHVNPKIGAAGDIACSPSPSADGGHPTVWGSGEGTNSSCQQKWVSDLICDTAGIAVPSDGSCDTNDATGSGYDKILLAGDIQYDCPRPSLFANGWGQLNSLGTYPVGWQRVQNVSNLVRPVPGNHEANRTPCGMTTTAGYDDGECYFQQFNGASGKPGDGVTSPCVPKANGDATPSDATNGG